jgi:putative tricarboxylic transport membrane protein
LLISGGDLSVFVSRPVAAILLMLNIALIMGQLPVARRAFARLKGRSA